MHNATYTTKFAQLANAERTHDAQLLSGVGTKHWSMDPGNQITYQKDDSHTLSIYLNGGTKNYRSDHQRSKGAPGKICLMPQGQDSQWSINEKVEFVHLYFSDEMLKRYAASSFGIDVRFVELSDLLFQDDDILQQLFTEKFLICRNIDNYSPLLAEQAINNVMHHLLKHYNGFEVKEEQITGGLSPRHIKLIREMVVEEITDKLSIEKLAASVNLSPYHFARMFKLSFGESPANYITRVRVDTTKRLLKGPDSLAQVSSQAGFSQQSHMSHHFKRNTGMTPGSYRGLVQH